MDAVEFPLRFVTQCFHGKCQQKGTTSTSTCWILLSYIYYINIIYYIHLFIYYIYCIYLSIFFIDIDIDIFTVLNFSSRKHRGKQTSDNPELFLKHLFPKLTIWRQKQATRNLYFFVFPKLCFLLGSELLYNYTKR